MKDNIKIYKLILNDGEYRDCTGEKEFYNAGDLMLVYKSADDYDYGIDYDKDYIFKQYESSRYRIYLNDELYQKENTKEWLDELIDETTLYINDVEYESLGVVRVMGDNDNLTILMCVEAD